ncbi:MAG: cytochrome c biogenesis protein CcsA [Bacteroidetes bacterium]|nr:cytochrome c biogenesis protein CcsA [Bacteroidota bacterium]MCL2302811.1 cytochrome c biogenesis protein CcsA [Lentimicrobiaceae bacterium]
MTQISTDFYLEMLLFGGVFIFCLAVASFLAVKKKEKSALFFQVLGVFSFAVFIIGMWLTLQRPPFKTMGETRIWYSFFLAILSGITYWRWRMNYLLIFVNLMASIFVVINICKPELQSQVLIPALQSVYFIPHVAIYMFAYAVIGCAFVLGVLELCNLFNHKGHKECTKNTNYSNLCVPCETLSVHCGKNKSSESTTKCDLLVKIGVVALGIGMCLGAIWAKKAWGQYWSWDVKENAALITWLIFLLYLHLAKIKKINRKILLVILIVGFLSLQFTWYGVKFLPSAQKSTHTFYSAN